MLLRTIATAALLGFSVPAAADTPAFGSPEWQARGCTLQQVHTPAGKPVQQAPIVRCKAEPTLAERGPDREVVPGAARTARD